MGGSRKPGERILRYFKRQMKPARTKIGAVEEMVNDGYISMVQLKGFSH